LKWAPDTGPNTVISTESIPAVAMVLPSSATPSEGADRACAMMPEPTTVATSRAVPRHSATTRRERFMGAR